ncbi:MAG: hypothetical protein DRQ64_01085 [Gammaproteobacteria bacterium]|nr:MAG: hypothetical protein DRQ64_01085 [Gammaproteobacteria bacterium]
MSFKKHDSIELIDLFNSKPYQGQSPEKASIIFLSSDANYSRKISDDPFFNYILEYQEDGVSFWKKHGRHHPFLLEEYPFNRSKDGVPYHRNFSKIGFNASYSDKVCFLELLDIPTIGNKSENRNLFYNLTSLPHLKYIDNLITGGGNKLFYIPVGVLNDMMHLKKKYNIFTWLSLEKTEEKPFSKTIHGNKVQQMYHFSSSQIHGQVGEIHLTANNWLEQKEAQSKTEEPR